MYKVGIISYRTKDLFHHSYSHILGLVKELKFQRIEDIQKYTVNAFAIASEKISLI